jgi:hypothetical protein
MGEEMKFFNEYCFYFFPSFYFEFYVFAAIILLCGTIFLKDKYKTESYNLLYVFNTLTAWCVLLYLGLGKMDLLTAWYGQEPSEWYAFPTERSSPYIGFVWVVMNITVQLFFGLLLFFRKLRISRLYTLFFLLLLNIGIIEILIFYSKDYLPSSWSVHPTPITEIIIKYAMMFCFLSLIYFIAKKKNKLPYPSLFLK